MPRTTAALTPEQARQRIQSAGITITEWSRRHGWNRQDVYDVLNGIKKGRFGRAHEIAVALGLKVPETSSVLDSQYVNPSTAKPAGNPQRAKAA
jgi:gp16 family phage-associated protein